MFKGRKNVLKKSHPHFFPDAFNKCKATLEFWKTGTISCSFVSPVPGLAHGRYLVNTQRMGVIHLSVPGGRNLRLIQSVFISRAPSRNQKNKPFFFFLSINNQMKNARATVPENILLWITKLIQAGLLSETIFSHFVKWTLCLLMRRRIKKFRARWLRGLGSFY